MLDKHKTIIYLSHLFHFKNSQGRPKGVTPKFSLAPLVPRLSELIGVEVLVLNERKANSHIL